MPLVSALMVFHRDTPYLRPAIASVLGQTLPDLELLLIDNGAGIASEALGEWGRDPRVRWVRRGTNGGIPAGHNAGVAAARGEYIALLDYDDIALPYRFARQIEQLRAHPAAGLVSSLAETIDASGAVVGREFALLDGDQQHAYTQFAAPVVTPAYTGRREVFAALPYREAFPWAADFDFLARAAEQWAFAGISEVLLQYRRHGEQTTLQRAGEIEMQRAAIRTATARRRRGADERLAELTASANEPLSPPEACLRWAQANFEEGLALIGAFHARRAIALDRRPATMVKAMQLFWAGIRHARTDEKIAATRLFFGGPLRALRITAKGSR